MRKFEIIARLVSHSKRMDLSLTYDTVIFKLCTKTLKTEHGFMFSYLNLIRPKKKKPKPRWSALWFSNMRIWWNLMNLPQSVVKQLRSIRGCARMFLSIRTILHHEAKELPSFPRGGASVLDYHIFKHNVMNIWMYFCFVLRLSTSSNKKNNHSIRIRHSSRTLLSHSNRSLVIIQWNIYIFELMVWK